MSNISVDALMHEIRNSFSEEEAKAIENVVKKVPVFVASRKEYRYDGGDYPSISVMCSYCGSVEPWEEAKYCPDCGAEFIDTIKIPESRCRLCSCSSDGTEETCYKKLKNEACKYDVPKRVMVEQKTGTWRIEYNENDDAFFRRRYYCSCCGDWTTYGMSDYCPHCGAKMEVPVTREEV